VRLRRKLFWVAVLYFAEGFPFGVVYDLLPVYYRVHGVSLTDIGLLSLLGMPWSLKVAWSPLIDRFGERRRWITSCLLGMGLILAAIPFLPPGNPTALVWGLLLAFTTLSATQDVAIDAYTIGLMDRGEEGAANSFRVSAYRAALVVSGGGLVALGGVLPWSVLFWMGGAILLLLAVAAGRTPPIRLSPEARRALFRPLWAWAKRPGSWAVFLFILTYKVGDSSMAPMIKPFWLDRGLSPAEIGLISTTIGVIASVAGAMVGGAWTTRIGIFRALWLLGLFQAFSNLGYTLAAAWDVSRGYIYAASIVESFTGGLGTAAFLSLLMNVCDREHAAVQYALLSALFGLTRSIAGAFSGWGADHLGYASYFGLTFLLAFPPYLLLPWVRGWIRERGTDPAAHVA
jgi:PAT family beta-lactamase induction signal transducer AmpG